jgi:hypothetical protein
MNDDQLPLRGFASLGKPDPLVICREIEPGLIECYNVMSRPILLVLEHLEEFK